MESSSGISPDSSTPLETVSLNTNGRLDRNFVGGISLSEGMGSPKCRRHPSYHGWRKPKLGCEICQDVYEFNRKHGIIEKRGPRAPGVNRGGRPRKQEVVNGQAEAEVKA